MRTGRMALVVLALLVAALGLALATAGDGQAGCNEFPWQVGRGP